MAEETGEPARPIGLVTGDTACATRLRELLGGRFRIETLDDAPPPSGPTAPAGVAARVLAPGLPFADVVRTPVLEEAIPPAFAAPVVLVSSTLIYEARVGHPGMAGERPARGLRTRSEPARSYRRLELEVERRCREVDAPLVVLRAAPIVDPKGDDGWHRWLRASVPATAAGYAPVLQFLALEDLCEAIGAAVRDPRPGVYHVVPDGVVPARSALRHAGRRGRLGLPAPVLRGLRGRRDRWVVARLCHAATAAGGGAECALGFRAAHGSPAVLERWARARRGAAGALDDSKGPLEETDDDGRGYDDDGLDASFCRRLSRTVLRVAHDRYFRVETQGFETVPRGEPFVLAGLHRGYAPYDAILLVHQFLRWQSRIPRFLIHPGLLKPPFIASLIVRLGGVVACQEAADRLLGRGDVVGVLPEGVRGAFSELRDAYRIRSFGRSDFVRIALRNGVPIVPFVTVGPAEALPILKLVKWSRWIRATGWPGLPLGFLAPFPVPLPSKWHTWYLEPLHVERSHPASAADDHEVVREISDEVRRRMRGALDAMLERRRSVWRGDVFPLDEPAGEVAP